MNGSEYKGTEKKKQWGLPDNREGYKLAEPGSWYWVVYGGGSFIGKFERVSEDLLVISNRLHLNFTDKGQEWQRIEGVILIPRPAGLMPVSEGYVKSLLANNLPYSKYLGQYVEIDGGSFTMGRVKRVFENSIELHPFLGRRQVYGVNVFYIVVDEKKPPKQISLPVKEISPCSREDLEMLVKQSEEDLELAKLRKGAEVKSLQQHLREIKQPKRKRERR